MSSIDLSTLHDFDNNIVFFTDYVAYVVYFSVFNFMQH